MQNLRKTLLHFCPGMSRNVPLARALRKFSMISIVVIAVLATFALLTQIGVVVFNRFYPQQGRTIEVAGAALNVVELGQSDSARPPVVMIHGASSNLEAMRDPLGRSARAQPPGDPDRSARSWLERSRARRGF